MLSMEGGMGNPNSPEHIQKTLRDLDSCLAPLGSLGQDRIGRTHRQYATGQNRNIAEEKGKQWFVQYSGQCWSHPQVLRAAMILRSQHYLLLAGDRRKITRAAG